ncbi:Tn3 family transposase [Streptomyces sp. NEAU-H22]|uniref:Tn3 family transposase n=1 Tax=Streptomyces sp. FXY-T5 TaxID=3064901 RepID=UPI0022543087|nr:MULTISPECIES: Tn3 family transposase [unclassified Streptomyces]MCX3290171.1 Tn3 family transposase [Streptomyces sp. NEAU-H22]WMD10065.1 Tn3 family transposase [Streptomyces sp. FXY-T5]
MIYWHVERKNVCIYSQLKSCSSSEVAAMIEGLLRHSARRRGRASRVGCRPGGTGGCCRCSSAAAAGGS